jgi:hypothetical protein
MIPARFQPLADSGSLTGLAFELAEQGYAIVRGAVLPELIGCMSRGLDQRFEATPFSVGPFHGPRTKRFHRLLKRSPFAPDLAMHGDILGAVRTLLGQWCDFPELNLTQGVEIHPGAPEQIAHCDQSMWPAPKDVMELCVNVFWPMGPFTADNGATRVWPGTHSRPRNPAEPLGPPTVCEMAPGDALVILGSTVHAAGANHTARPRRAAIVSYCLGWLKAYENQSLAYPPEFARTLEPELAAMVGYRWHRPNLGTYDGQCPSILLDGPPPEHLATVDRLMPEHSAALAAFEAAHPGRSPSPARQ